RPLRRHGHRGLSHLFRRKTQRIGARDSRSSTGTNRTKLGDQAEKASKPALSELLVHDAKRRVDQAFWLARRDRKLGQDSRMDCAAQNESGVCNARFL